MAKRYNISVPSEYHKDGSLKTKWSNVGKLIEFKPGEFLIELYMFPTTKFCVFEEKQRGEKVEKPEEKEVVYPEGYPSPEAVGANPDEIPF